MKRIPVVLVLSAMLFVVSGGCFRYSRQMDQTRPVTSDYVADRQVSGRGCKSMLFGIIPLGPDREPEKEAFRESLQGQASAVLVDILVDYEVAFWILGTTKCVDVTAMTIRESSAAGGPMSVWRSSEAVPASSHRPGEPGETSGPTFAEVTGWDDSTWRKTGARIFDWKGLRVQVETTDGPTVEGVIDDIYSDGIRLKRGGSSDVLSPRKMRAIRLREPSLVQADGALEAEPTQAQLRAWKGKDVRVFTLDGERHTGPLSEVTTLRLVLGAGDDATTIEADSIVTVRLLAR